MRFGGYKTAPSFGSEVLMMRTFHPFSIQIATNDELSGYMPSHAPSMKIIHEVTVDRMQRKVGCL